MLASWIGDGFSQPFSKIPIRSSRFKQNSSNSFPRVSVTSCKAKIQIKHRIFELNRQNIRETKRTLVLILWSFGGIFSFDFHPIPSSRSLKMYKFRLVKEFRLYLRNPFKRYSHFALIVHIDATQNVVGDNFCHNTNLLIATEWHTKKTSIQHRNWSKF